MKFKYLILLTLYFFESFGSQYLSLPGSLKNKPVYHVKVKQLDNWSCGYNALFNACKSEKEFGKNNKFCDFDKFSSVCLDYLKKINQKPSSSSSNKILEDLSKSLDLKILHYLTFDKNNQIVPLFTTPTHISYPSNTPKAKIKELMDQAVNKREKALIDSLKKELEQNKNKLFFLHFICHIGSSSQGHAILISLVQNSSGKKALYIYDNLNSMITESAQAKKYIDFLFLEKFLN